ncbi:DUF6249 domain-containing protein [Thalassotalea atypica]|uniref:DUF6249 domain-containing protein n=1 Tax=Thalassotalea atypica TaxID=2054316 RepID=UPI00257378FD|nr:DUF6249 domain-containing protein [Thalassotalea atypica]
MAQHIIPIVLFISIATVLLGLIVNRTKMKSKQQQTLQRLIESGQALSPELVMSISKQTQSEHADFSRGVLLIGFACAVIVYGLYGLDDEPGFSWLGIFPLAIGIAFLVINKVKQRAAQVA